MEEEYTLFTTPSLLHPRTIDTVLDGLAMRVVNQVLYLPEDIVCYTSHSLLVHLPKFTSHCPS